MKGRDRAVAAFGLLLLAACSSQPTETPVTREPASGDIIVTCETGTAEAAGGTVTVYDPLGGVTRTVTLDAGMTKAQVCGAIREAATRARLTATIEGDGDRVRIIGGAGTLYVLGAKVTIAAPG